MIIAIDFDSVIMNEKNGTPVDGAKEAIQSLLDAGHQPYVLTARKGKDIEYANNWLILHIFPILEVTDIKKLHTRVLIDDRAIRFTNWMDVLKYFK